MNFFLLFLFSVAFGVNTDENCGKIDGSEGSCIAPLASSPNEKQQILDKINFVRNEVAAGNFDCGCTPTNLCPKAKKMLKLVWSDALANSAQDYINAKSPYTEGYYVNGVRKSHSDETERTQSAYDHCQSTSCAANIQSNDTIGENIYNKYKWSSSNGVITRTIYSIFDLIAKASQKWDDDEALNLCPAVNVFDHFTQDVWDDTMYIGCGTGLFDETSLKLRNVIICQYFIEGNIEDQTAYETTTGSPSCPTGFQLDTQFPKLCVSSSSVKTKIKNILNVGKIHKFNLFDPANYSFLEIVVLILIIIVLVFGIAGCVLIYKRRKLKKELGNKDLHTELSGEAQKSKNIKKEKEKEEKQTDIQINYNPEPEKATFDDSGLTIEKI